MVLTHLFFLKCVCVLFLIQTAHTFSVPLLSKLDLASVSLPLFIFLYLFSFFIPVDAFV